MTIVVGRGQKDELLTMLSESGIHLVNIIYGEGAAKGGVLMNILGFVPEKHKVMISCITTYAKSEAVLKLLLEEYDFDKPNTGIAFTIPVDKVSY